MKHFIRNIAIGVGILIAFIFCWGRFCDWYFAETKYFDDKTNKRAWALKLEDRKYDYGVLGSSRAYSSFDMVSLNSLLGLKGVNLGANGSGYVDNFLVLYLFLANGNVIDTLFLQVDIYSLDSKANFSNAFHTYQFLPYWRDSIVANSLYPYLDAKERLLWEYLPDIRYFKFNKYFSPKEVVRRYQFSKQHVSGFDKTFGGPPGESFEEGGNKMSADREAKERSFDDLDVAYLLKIIQLCKANYIYLVAYKAPELSISLKNTSNYSALQAEIDEMLTQRNVPYIEFNEVSAGDADSFSDPTHLNSRGREAFTKSFSTEFLRLKSESF
ncbi:hypothetical protein WBG78_07215 [Chryseolinea sp. T2]|uniref:hypothetical protein n=1 Tax=Chryseolinea sp. T2 TaxID=3129255 RepID=UPI00307725FF